MTGPGRRSRGHDEHRASGGHPNAGNGDDFREDVREPVVFRGPPDFDGANIILCDPHRAVVVGPTPLSHREMSSPDIRAGCPADRRAMRQGRQRIQNIDQIDRGYERLDERLACWARASNAWRDEAGYLPA